MDYVSKYEMYRAFDTLLADERIKATLQTLHDHYTACANLEHTDPEILEYNKLINFLCLHIPRLTGGAEILEAENTYKHTVSGLDLPY